MSNDKCWRGQKLIRGGIWQWPEILHEVLTDPHVAQKEKQIAPRRIEGQRMAEDVFEFEAEMRSDRETLTLTLTLTLIGG